MTHITCTKRLKLCMGARLRTTFTYIQLIHLKIVLCYVPGRLTIDVIDLIVEGSSFLCSCIKVEIVGWENY